MAKVQVIQRHAHLAGEVKLEFVNGREGKVAKAVLTAISNTRRGTGDGREDDTTVIQWTVWGQQAENAAAYLGKGSHVNIVGHVRNNNYPAADGGTVYALAFSGDEIDYLDSRAESDARRSRQAFVAEMDAGSAPGGRAPRADHAAAGRPDADRQPRRAKA